MQAWTRLQAGRQGGAEHREEGVLKGTPPRSGIRKVLGEGRGPCPREEQKGGQQWAGSGSAEGLGGRKDRDRGRLEEETEGDQEGWGGAWHPFPGPDRPVAGGGCVWTGGGVCLGHIKCDMPRGTHMMLNTEGFIL